MRHLRSATDKACRLLGPMMVSASAAHAEPVAIEGATGETGVGWLFGSPQDARCYVVTANHVVDDENGDPKRFLWRGLDGREGVGAAPFGDAGLDIAFGRASGVEPSDCLSRLGPLDATSVIRRQPEASLLQPISTSARPIQVQIGPFDETRFQAEGVEAQDVQLLQRGVSGAMLTLRRDDGAEIPLGVVTNADPTGGVVATRADATRRVFSARDAEAAGSGPVTNGAPVEIRRSTGESRDPASDVSALLREGACWSVSPGEDRRAVHVELTSVETAFNNARLDIEPECGVAPTEVYAAIPRGSGWRHIASCPVSGGVALCRFTTIDPGTVMRLSLIRRDGATMGIASVTLRSVGSE